MKLEIYNIDYILTSATNDITHFEVLDPDVNFSDHLPLVCDVSDGVHAVNNQSRGKRSLLTLNYVGTKLIVLPIT